MANLVMGYRLASRTPCSSLALLSTDKEMVLFGNALSLPRTAFNTIFLQRYIISHPEPCIHASICEGKKETTFSSLSSGYRLDYTSEQIQTFSEHQFE